MKKHVLFIQGAGEGAYNADSRLVASLRRLLGPTYEVHYPVMRDEGEANYKTWVSQIKKELAELDGTIILVGHSVGASVLIKFLLEEESNKTTSGIFLIAAPYWGNDGGWTYEGYETLTLPREGITHVPVFLYQSRDDEVVPFTHLVLYTNMFPGATVREFHARGHQLNDDLSEVASDIKTL